ncbi:tRNA (adenosine(37)-N6)-threonylcarbamoyltransferase complex dimerization subunit type 1 TsaB [Paenibacillus sp. JX-17]|uniref:tRNA (Adenosine(37)-N6)-threonylcarbamoyltransferase complex dimerization subunit type 1 TsaB n=1 Tax=Paenibacillus lacisoli TaxID=3064525 RepID=A0ABT9CDC1_9BACL|nr:tRNA (adenosine(37)-N6)-threonylcarbamoyltransferase complex dimerization subunit type 1 TsaB [Paenibacillus sp. JX-17]MDO7907231.1 tRNA (adenosine(37)-N6)-threonylcarbamoyltransferase complex dimerization subunit type 1 TsaB [Paenibacillus sp. JX-17]
MQNEQDQPRQRFLALDTATHMLASALMDGEKVAAEINTSAERNQSVHVVPVLQRLLSDQGLSRSDIHGLAVGVGPGSYTGIRIAVTAAKTLAWAWKVPVVGVSSLQAIAWGAQTKHEDSRGNEAESARVWIVPMMDARRGQAYTSLFAAGRNGEKPSRLEDDGIRLMSDWLSQLHARVCEAGPADQPAAIWLVGEPGTYGSMAEEMNFPIPVAAVPYELEGRWIGKLGAERLLRGESDEYHELIPNYTQLSEAEANLLRKR